MFYIELKYEVRIITNEASPYDSQPKTLDANAIDYSLEHRFEKKLLNGKTITFKIKAKGYLVDSEFATISKVLNYGK